MIIPKTINPKDAVMFDIDDTLIELDRCVIGQTPTLVNTSEFHSVDMNDRKRIVLSLRFEWVVPWEQHLEIFKSVLL
jgi:FMN phosphatase YigB (HAD superfamily)